MARKDWGVVNNRAMLWTVNNLHWNELCAEWKDIQFCSNRVIGFKNFLDRFAFNSPPWEFEDWSSIPFGSWGWKTKGLSVIFLKISDLKYNMQHGVEMNVTRTHVIANSWICVWVYMSFVCWLSAIARTNSCSFLEKIFQKKFAITGSSQLATTVGDQYFYC